MLTTEVLCKESRFPFEENFRLEFPETFNAELNSIFQNFQIEDNFARYMQVYDNFLPEISVPFDFPFRISAVCG